MDVAEQVAGSEQVLTLTVPDVAPRCAQQVAYHVVTELEAHCVESVLHGGSHPAQERHVQHGSVVRKVLLGGLRAAHTPGFDGLVHSVGDQRVALVHLLHGGVELVGRHDGPQTVVAQRFVSQDEVKLLLRPDAVGEHHDLSISERVADGVDCIEVTLRAGSHGLAVERRVLGLEISLVTNHGDGRCPLQLSHEVAHKKVDPPGGEREHCLTIEVNDTVDGVEVGQSVTAVRFRGYDLALAVDHGEVRVAVLAHVAQQRLITEARPCGLLFDIHGSLPEAVTPAIL